MTVLVMNADGEIDHKSGSAVSGGTFVITSTPSATVKIDAKGVYVGPLKYTFSGGNASGFVNGTVATVTPQSIPATATKTAIDGDAPMRLDDFAAMACEGTLSGDGGGTGAVSGAVVEVSEAGQDNTECD